MVSYTDLEQDIAGDVNQQQLHNSSEAGEINELGMMAKDQDLPAPATTGTQQKETKDQNLPAPATTGTQQKERKRYNPKIRVQSMGLSPMIVPLSAREGQNEVAARFETHVKELIENLKSTALETVREATSELRILAKDLDNQILIASCGAISPLVDLLCSSDMITQENAVTAVLNLSISNNNKVNIVKAEAIEPLIHVLQTGTDEARENAAATLYSLSVFEENKIRIGNSGAIGALVDLLGNGTPRGRKDAATALFYLSTCTDNRLTIVRSGAVKHLIDLMDPATGMVDRVVVVLANLASGPEGRKAIAEAGGISLLVEAVELGSPRGKENAAAALVHFCADSNRYCRRVLEEGAVPPLVILSMSGTSRAKEKANRILQHLRNLQAAYNDIAGGSYT